MFRVLDGTCKDLSIDTLLIVQIKSVGVNLRFLFVCEDLAKNLTDQVLPL